MENKLNEANITLEEQIFFEKQMHSLAEGKADELHQEINKLHIDMDKLNITINELNEDPFQILLSWVKAALQPLGLKEIYLY